MKTLTIRDRVMAVLRQDEWRGGQLIAREVFELGDGPWQPQLGARTRRCLRELEAEGLVERRAVTHRPVVLGEDEWRARLRPVSAW